MSVQFSGWKSLLTAQKSLTIMEEINKLVYIKSKNFCSLRDPIFKRMKKANHRVEDSCNTDNCQSIYNQNMWSTFINQQGKQDKICKWTKD